MSTVGMLLGQWATILIPAVVKQHKISYDTFYGLVAKEAERIKSGKDPRVSIMDDVYQKVMDGSLPETVDEKHLRAALMSVLFAGHDVGSGATSR
jgi:hypothetical protein